ncbi:hypothetical protein NDU88_003531 [Pleurodeles waltl]|uniref:Uncharacterized protein n=1 Tax=Pleurodeles waltl TaxID=8319 RepID=A0AAV7RG64_PLEWA|nr:hypothetical protein NDU88_003531 [Pleurodeles waltl]
MLAKPSRGLRDSVLGTFPLIGPEDETQDRGSHPWAVNQNWQGKPPPAPSWCSTLEEGSALPRAWWGLVRAHELSHAGEASLGPPVPCPRHTVGWRTKPRIGVPTQPLAQCLDGGPDHDLAEEVSPGQPGDLDAP